MEIPGAIGFSADRSWISAVIRWFTRSQWGHTWIGLYDDSDFGMAMVLEANAKGVTVEPFRNYQKPGISCEIFFPTGFSADEISRGMMAALGKFDRPYGFFQLIGYVPLILLKRIFGLKIHNPFTGGVVCSELVLAYLRALEPGGQWDAMRPDDTWPEDFYERIKLHPKFTRGTA